MYIYIYMYQGACFAALPIFKPAVCCHLGHSRPVPCCLRKHVSLMILKAADPCDHCFHVYMRNQHTNQTMP